MEYNFDLVTPRRGTGSYKWDSAQDPRVLPMWVADMDFPTAPAIREALRRRVEHGIFGYTRVPQAYYDAITSWFARRHGWHIDPSWIIYTTGVVPAISAIIKALTCPGDKVLVQTPVYNCFFSSIRNNGCETIENPLVATGDTYVIDYDRMEQLAARDDVKLFLLCNPHNPACRVWTRDELVRMGDICLRHNVVVVADEIHCELTMPGYKYTPFASLGDAYSHNSVTCVSPSKAFNIAGLQIANIVCDDAARRSLIDRAININEVCDVNPFGVDALIAAYTHGEPWLRDLCNYIYDNYRAMKEYCDEHLPRFPLTRLEGTYLVWMDCRCLEVTSHDLEERLRDEAQLWLNAGTMYGAAGEGFMRWNIACPRAVLIDGLQRFEGFVKGE